MNEDPYWETIEEHLDSIYMVYGAFRGKDQIIEFDVVERKIYSYPSADYIRQLSERTRDQTARLFAETQKQNQFILFVKDTGNRRVRSYLLDLPYEFHNEK